MSYRYLESDIHKYTTPSDEDYHRLLKYWTDVSHIRLLKYWTDISHINGPMIIPKRITFDLRTCIKSIIYGDDQSEYRSTLRGVKITPHVSPSHRLNGYIPWDFDSAGDYLNRLCLSEFTPLPTIPPTYPTKDSVPEYSMLMTPDLDGDLFMDKLIIGRDAMRFSNPNKFRTIHLDPKYHGIVRINTTDFISLYN